MKINGLQIDTLSSKKYGRFGLDSDGKMMVQPTGSTYTAEEVAGLSAAYANASHVLLGEGELVESPAPAADKPDCATCQNKIERDKFYAMVKGYNKPLTIEDFKDPDQKIAVILKDCGEWDTFMAELDKRGIKHPSGIKATEWGYQGREGYGGPTCVSLFGFGGLGFDTANYWRSKGYKVVPFSAFSFAPRTLYTVTITEETTLKEYKAILGEVFKHRNARREKEQPVQEVDRPAQRGEWVKITAPKGNVGYSLGDIKRVSRICHCGCALIINSEGDERHLLSDDYRVLVGYHPEAAHD